MTPASEFFGQAGTSSAALPAPPARHVLAPVVQRPVLSAAQQALFADAFGGTGVTVVTREDVRGWQQHVLEAGTSLPVLAEPARAGSAADAAAAVRELRRRSGLTWQELADALGVSRRAVHLWVNGGGVSTWHIRMIDHLTGLVSELAADDPAVTRERLLAPQPSGFSLLAEFRESSRPRRRVPLSTLSVADLLTSEPLGEMPPMPPPARRSRLAPKRLGPGRSASE
jgi:transcriptional regulator with XRE-family HTH domain